MSLVRVQLEEPDLRARSLSGLFCISISWLSLLSRSPSFTKNHSKPYPFAGKNVGNGSSIALLPTNGGCRYALTVTKVKNAKPLNKEYKLTDGFGMFLRVTPKGSKYWQMACRFEGKQKIFSIGVYPVVSLADARQRRDEAKRLLAQGTDPNAKKQADVKELKAKRDNTRSFKAVAKAWFSTKKKWSKDYQNTVWTRLDNYIFPDIGNRDVTDLATGDLLVPIKKVEALAYLEVATRVKQYVTSILHYAVQQQLIRYNPAYDLEGSIQKPETEHRVGA